MAGQATEERQKIGPIREGAGLDESRLNEELIEFLRKFSTPLLACIVLVAGGYFGWTQIKARRELARDTAFAQLDAAAESRNPVTLVRVAEEHNVAAVPHLARLTAADIHLDASRTGVPIGTTPNNDGSLPEDAQPLSDEQKAEELAKAEGLYKQVFESARNDSTSIEYALMALHGLAACAESRGDLDAARNHYQQLIDLAKSSNRQAWAARAEKLKSSVDELTAAPRLYQQSELSAAAAAIQPFTSGMQNLQLRTTTGETLRIGEDGQIERVPTDEQPAAPAETPASEQPAEPASTPPAPSEPAEPN